MEKEFSQENQNKWKFWVSGIATSLAILLAVVSIFYKNTAEQNILLTLNNQNSSVYRLKGIYECQELQKEDEEFTTKLIELLHQDENNNVKIDALKDFPDNDHVREALIEALEKEPIIQIELIKTISELREKRATPSLQKVINNQKTIDYETESALYT